MTSFDSHVRRARARFCLYFFNQPRAIASGVEIEFHFAGHILGSSIVSVEIDSATAGHKNTRLVFSGDLGRPDHPLLRPPDPPPAEATG